MSNLMVKPSSLQGTLTLPTSKSQTMRAILLASLANGESVIHAFLHSPDTEAMIKACRALGADILVEQQQLHIKGVAGKPCNPQDIIECGNSGQVLRFIAAFASLLSESVVITGDESIKQRRPMAPLLSGLRQLGAECYSLAQNGRAPVIIKGPAKAGTVKIQGQDSQPVSALLMLASLLSGTTFLEVLEAGELPWIQLTLSWLRRLGVKITSLADQCYRIEGQAHWSGFDYRVPADLSAMAFPVVAALITGSELSIRAVDLSDCQGDKKILEYLRCMGADLHYSSATQTLYIPAQQRLRGIEIDMNQAIDALPIMAVAACFADSASTFCNIAMARYKESDRLAAMEQELNKMGGRVCSSTDSLTVQPAVLTGRRLSCYNDHRIAMALAVAGLASTGSTRIDNSHCMDKSFPHFVSSMRALGAEMTHLP